MQSGPTASLVISFAEKLEDTSTEFYDRLSKEFEKGKELFNAFGAEGKKNKVLIIRTYQETITDALEACFCFTGLNLEDYVTTTEKDVSYPESLQVAIELEKKATQFYSDVAEKSRSLLATVHMALKTVGGRRRSRQAILSGLLDESRAK